MQIYLEYHSVCPLVGIGTPHPPLPPSECVPPLNQRGEGHTCLWVRVWRSPNSDDWRKILALCLLCGVRVKKTVYSQLFINIVSCDEQWRNFTLHLVEIRLLKCRTQHFNKIMREMCIFRAWEMGQWVHCMEHTLQNVHFTFSKTPKVFWDKLLFLQYL